MRWNNIIAVYLGMAAGAWLVLSTWKNLGPWALLAIPLSFGAGLLADNE